MPAKKTTGKKTKASKSSGAKTAGRASTPTAAAKSGDLIVIDSAQVGSPPREGEVLEVVQGEVSVSYRIRWADGHETLITPKGGTARVVRASKKG